jgi:hypothetical protein
LEKETKNWEQIIDEEEIRIDSNYFEGITL